MEYCQAKRLAQTYCAQGLSVTWKRFDGEHALGWTRGISSALGFINQVLTAGTWLTNGTPFNSCASQAAEPNADPQCN